MARKYSNISKVMTLSAGISNTDTSITVDDATGLPVAFPYALALAYETANVEIVLCTAAAGNVLTITRGQEDTSAKAHSIGATVVHVATALDLQNAANHIEATQDVHGVGAGSAVVGTSTTQTLINKTIDAANNTLQNIPSGAITSLAGSKITGVITVATINADQVTGPYGNVVVDQPAAASPALDVTVNAGTSVPTTRLASRAGQDALQINRNDSNTSGNLTNWRDQAGTSIASVSRAGNLVAGDINANGAIGALGGISTFSNIQAANFIATGNFQKGTRNIDTETIQRFPTVAARTTAIPTPTAGMASWCDDRRTVDVYSSGAWRPITGLGCLVATSTYDAGLTGIATVTPWSIVTPPTEAANWTASGSTITCLTAGTYQLSISSTISIAAGAGPSAGRLHVDINAIEQFLGGTVVLSGFGNMALEINRPFTLAANDTIALRAEPNAGTVRFFNFGMIAQRLY